MDAVWGGKWIRSRDGCIRWGWRSSKGKGAVLEVNMGHPIVTNGDLWQLLFSAMRGGDAALPKLLWDFLSCIRTQSTKQIQIT